MHKIHSGGGQRSLGICGGSQTQIPTRGKEAVAIHGGPKGLQAKLAVNVNLISVKCKGQ